MCLALFSTVRGDIIFDNFDEGGGFHPQDNLVAASASINPPFTVTIRAAVQFTVAGRDFTLNSIILPISVDKSQTAPDVFKVRLTEDNGGVPGTTVEVLSSNGSQWPAVANPFTTITTLTSSGHPLLLLGRSYWIVTELTALPAQTVDCRWFVNTSGNEVPFRQQQAVAALPADPWNGSLLAANAAFRVEGAPLPQIAQLINYQGRIALGTPAVNFEGSGQFKFALVDGGSSATLWSNDGTGSAGSEPAAAVTLPVTKGLYSVLLGNTALPHMTAIPYSVFARLDVRLRVWFDDGTHGFQLLTPDQRIAAVGYAMMDANVPDGTITGTKLAAGAVGSASIAAGAIGSTQLAANAVQGGNIAAGAVGSAQIASGAIGFSALVKPPQSGMVDSAGLTFDFGQASFSVAFPHAFAATPVVTLSLAPGSSTFPPQATAQVTSSTNIQFGGKLAAFTSQPVTLDKPGYDAGSNSLAVVDGYPAISYCDDTNGVLKFLCATDASGTTWGGVPVTPDSAGYVGWDSSLTVVNGNPAISYWDVTNRDLKYVRATDVRGTAWNSPMTLDSTGSVGSYPPRHVRQLKDATLENSRPGQYCSLSPMPEWGRKRAAGRMPAPQVARASCPEPLIPTQVQVNRIGRPACWGAVSAAAQAAQPRIRPMVDAPARANHQKSPNMNQAICARIPGHESNSSNTISAMNPIFLCASAALRESLFTPRRL